MRSVRSIRRGRRRYVVSHDGFAHSTQSVRAAARGRAAEHNAPAHAPCDLARPVPVDRSADEPAYACATIDELPEVTPAEELMTVPIADHGCFPAQETVLDMGAAVHVHDPARVPEETDHQHANRHSDPVQEPTASGHAPLRAAATLLA